jgi:hypothetical protein
MLAAAIKKSYKLKRDKKIKVARGRSVKRI